MHDLNRKSVEEFRNSAKKRIVVVLENIRSAYNVGSIFRTADAFLIEAVYLCGYTAFPPHKEIKKTALGADETVSWKHFKNVQQAIDELQQQNYLIYAIEQANTSMPLQNAVAHLLQNTKTAIILGNEVAGVEQSTLLQCNGCIEIPQWGMKHSLNVSVAAGIVLWELVRNSAGSAADEQL